jgi:hypothetical protein
MRLRLFRLRAGGLAATAVLLAVAWPSQAEPIQAAEIEPLRTAASALAEQLGSVLRSELERGGAAAAVKVCRDVAPAVAGELSRRHGWRVTRVSLATRNPLLGTADAWEQAVLLSFAERLAKGEPPAGVEHAEVVTEPAGRYLRYMRALPMQPACLQCHGNPAQLAPEVTAELAQRYPFDRATGHELGQLRGAVSIKRPLPPR